MSNPVKTAVGTTAVKISNAGTRMTGRLVRNLGAGIVYLGESNTITSSGATMGWAVAAGADFSDIPFTGELWAISASGSNDVQVWRLD